MKTLLYILLGLSLGAGTTLIVLQERFVRERRRLMAMGESQRAKAAQAAQSLEEANKAWEQRCQQLTEEVQGCETRIREAETSAPAPPAEDQVPRAEHEGLLQEIQAKDTELSRLAAENRTLAEHLAKHRDQIADLQGQLTLLQGELERVAAEKTATPDDDFVLLGRAGGHLLPGPVVRAFIKGRQGSRDGGGGENPA